MTDTTSAPVTGSDLEPMFTTGSQTTAAPTTEPHPAPIFDTGPHPGPLNHAAYETDTNEADPFRADDSGSEPVLDIAFDEPDSPAPQAFSALERDDTDAFLRAVTPDPIPTLNATPVARPVLVPGTNEFVARWRFALILAGVWVVAAAAGLGFYHWWYTAGEKTLPVLGILGYLAVCMAASVLLSLVPNRPRVTALAVAVMAAPLASTAAAAVLHGAYYFEWIARPVIGPVIG
ncbi:hypothetical protein MCEMAEM6B_01246 [Mycobacteriaceae bacterium]